MADIFIDVNYLIDLTSDPEKSKEIQFLDTHTLYLSTLTCHILFYVKKIGVPNEEVNSFLDEFKFIPLSEPIMKASCIGPLADFEDNVQLHSAAEANCSYFLTYDRGLLNMKFFGKMMIVSELPKN